MKKLPQIYISSLLFLLLTLSSCTLFVPVHSEFETAETVGEGNLAVQTNFEQNKNVNIVPADYRKAESINAGLKVTYGLSDNVDVDFRYQYARVDIKNQGYWPFNVSDRNYPLHSAFFSMKSQKSEHFAVRQKVGIYFGEQALPRSELTERFPFLLSYEPQFIFSTRVLGDQLEPYIMLKANLTTMGIVPIRVGLGANTGLSFSTNFDKWALRSEVGYQQYIFQNNFSAGMSFTYFFKKKDFLRTKKT